MPLQVLYIITLNLERVKLVNKVIKMMVTFPQKIPCAKRWTYLVLGWTQFLRFPMVLGPSIEFWLKNLGGFRTFFYEAWPNQWSNHSKFGIFGAVRLDLLQKFEFLPIKMWPPIWPAYPSDSCMVHVWAGPQCMAVWATCLQLITLRNVVCESHHDSG